MKTLFVSDLNGTLLRSDGSLSDATVRILNQLMRGGMSFTYATARSIQSAMEITGDLDIRLPVVLRNGTILAEHASGKILKKAVFTRKEADLIRDQLPELASCGFVSSHFGDEMRKNCCLTGSLSKGLVTLIDEKERLRPVYERLKQYKGWECVFQQDTYSEDYWLEICPENSTKAKAILRLKESLNADKLVVFGDSVNDLPMFRIADESFAVENAIDEIRRCASGIIGRNDEDGVARYLQSRLQSGNRDHPG